MKTRFCRDCLIITSVFAALLTGCMEKEPTFKEEVMEAMNFFHKGEEERLAGDLLAAANAYRRSIAISPRPIAHLHLAHVLIELGEFEEARTHLEESLESNPGYRRAMVENERLEAKVTVVERTGQLPPKPDPVRPFPPPPVEPVSEAVLVEAEPSPEPTLTPEQQEKIDPLIAEARQASREGRHKDAIAAYRTCIEIAPDYGKLYYYLGNVYLTTGDLERAHLEFRHALSLNSNLPGAYNNLGVVYEGKGQTEEAVQAYRDAIRVGDHTDAYYNLAVLLEKRGQWEEALKLYRSYLERDSGSSWAQKARQRIEALERALY